MRAVVQRVLNASVAVDGKTISQIGRGLMVLVGIERNDTPDDAAWIIKKVLAAKLWDDEKTGAWRRSVTDLGGEVLCVSQFTLFANFKGARPDFHESMSTAPGKAMYTSFLEQIGKAYEPSKIKDGEFGAMMAVSLTNDGPVTVIFDSRERKPSGSGAATPTSKSTKSASGANTPVSAEEAQAIARAKVEARAAKKAAWEARKAAGDAPGTNKDGAGRGEQAASEDKA